MVHKIIFIKESLNAYEKKNEWINTSRTYTSYTCRQLKSNTHKTRNTIHPLPNTFSPHYIPICKQSGFQTESITSVYCVSLRCSTVFPKPSSNPTIPSCQTDMTPDAPQHPLEDHTLPDFKVVPITMNSHRNVCLVARRRMTNENMCSKIGWKYQTCLISSDWIGSKSEAKKSESVTIIHYVIFCGFCQL